MYGYENSYAALAGCGNKEPVANRPSLEPGAAPPPDFGADIKETAPEAPEASRAQVELISEERAVDVFAVSAKAKQGLLQTQGKNLRRREASKRRAREDACLGHGVYKAFTRESAVKQEIDPSIWPFIPFSKEAALQMGREYAVLEALVLLVKQNHWLRCAQLCAPPQTNPPDWPGCRVCFANPLVTSDHAPTPHHMACRGHSGMSPLALSEQSISI